MNVINGKKIKTQGHTATHPLKWLRLRMAKNSKVEKLLVGM